MTAEELIAEARRNRTPGRIDADALSPSNLSGFLRFALAHLLDDLDYEKNPASGSAIAARTLAAIISGADDVAGETHGH